MYVDQFKKSKVRCLTCELEERWAANSQESRESAVIEINSESVELTKKALRRMGSRVRCIVVHSQSAEQLAKAGGGAIREILERPNVTFVQFDSRQLTMRDMVAWCRAGGVKQVLSVRVVVNTRQMDKERGSPAQSNAAQVELQQAYMVIDTVKAVSRVDPEAIIMVETAVNSTLLTRRSVRGGNWSLGLLRVQRPAGEAMVLLKGVCMEQVVERMGQKHGEEVVRLVWDCKKEQTGAGTKSISAWRGGQPGVGLKEGSVALEIGQGKTCMLKMAEEDIKIRVSIKSVEQEEDQDEDLKELLKRAGTWYIRADLQETEVTDINRWLQEVDWKLGINDVRKIVWHLDGKESGTQAEEQRRWQLNQAGLKFMQGIAQKQIVPLMLVTWSWQAGFTSNSTVRQMVENDWWLCNTEKCTSMSALIVKGINPMECESLNKQRLNEKQLMKSLLQKHNQYEQQCDGSDFWCAVCEDGSDTLDLIICDNTQCNRVQHSACSSESNTTAKWLCETCTVGQRRGGEALLECGVGTLSHTQARNREGRGGGTRRQRHNEKQARWIGAGYALRGGGK